MKINELRDGTKKVDVTGTVVNLGAIVDGAGWTRSNALLKDETGTIELVLWDKDNLDVAKGDKIRIENGYVKAYQGTLQLSRGKFGKLTVLEQKKVSEPQKMDNSQNIFDAARYHLDMLSQIFNDLEKHQ